MTVRPINFRDFEMRALLEGRKTQDRRVIKPVPEYCGPAYASDPQNWNDPESWGWENHETGGWDLLSEGFMGRLPYAPGDLLWVREGWRVHRHIDETLPRHMKPTEIVECRADGGFNRSVTNPPEWWAPGRPRPSIHMPRWASRLTLRVTDVRVQRVQEMDRGDAMEEGCPFANMAKGPNPRDWFRDLWNTLHKPPHDWSGDPWVSAITFDVIRKNVDEVER